MADITEKTGNGELVANCDRLQNDEVVVTTPVESRIMSIRGNQIMIDRNIKLRHNIQIMRFILVRVVPTNGKRNKYC